MKRPGIAKGELFQLGLILLVALLHGIFYIFLMPPWQHYDEPNHFEHVWLAANLGRLVTQEDYDLEMSRAVIVSMVRNHFYKDIGPNSAWGDPNAQVKIPGLSQLNEPPVYYQLAGLPVRWLQAQDVAAQLYAARFVSLFFLLITILAAWGMVRELTRPGNHLRWILPFTLALMPGFIDVMTAVNDDAAAVACASLFFWGSARLLRRKLSFINVFWVLITAAASVWIKNTAMVVLAGLPVVLLLGFLRGKLRWLAWGMILVGSIAVMLVLWDGEDTAYWYRATTQQEAVRYESQEAVHGQYVLRLISPAKSLPSWVPAVYQTIPVDTGRALQGKKMSLGFWAWASEPVKINGPSLNTPVNSKTRSLELTETPQFFTIRMNMPEGRTRLWVNLASRLSGGPEATLYFDGFVLAEGKRPIDQPPETLSEDTQAGVWGGEPFENLIRNPSAETGWLRMRPIWDEQSTRLLPDDSRISMIMTTLLDIKDTQNYYRNFGEHLFRTFWAKFGWGHISLMGQKPYRFLAIVTLISVLGMLAGVIRFRRSIPWDVVFVFALVSLLSWLATITRWIPFMTIAGMYAPTARHSYTVILPVMLALTFGWMQIITLLTWGGKAVWRRLRPDGDAQRFGSRLESLLIMGYVALLLLLDVFSFISIANFYHFI